MRKIMDKLVSGLKINKKMVIFLVTIGIISIVVGSIFVVVLNNDDKYLITKYLNDFFNNIKDNKLNYLNALKNVSISNYLYIFIIWLLGISVIGIPIMIFMYFMKCFMLGFSIASILINYKFKGLLLSLIYIFPHHIIAIIIYTILLVYSLTLSIKIGQAFLFKKCLNFKLIINKYLFVLIISFAIITLTNLYEVYLLPIVLKNFI